MLQPVKTHLISPHSKDISSSNHFSDTLVFPRHLPRSPSRTHKCAKDRAQKTASKMESLYLMHRQVFILGNNLKGSDVALIDHHMPLKGDLQHGQVKSAALVRYPTASSFTKGPATFLC